jgi:HAD superfamily hydrolase (TIGR01459 family)
MHLQKDCGDLACLTSDAPTPSAACQSSAAGTKFRDGLSAAVAHYDTFLIDQWGVLHDGRKPYPGAVQCLFRLRETGKQVILISNSGRRTSDNKNRLNNLGVPEESYSHLVTSGEIAWQLLAARRGAFSSLPGKRCLLLCSDDRSEFPEGLPILLADAEEADFILLAGIDDQRPQEYYDRIVATGLRRGLRLICANPDLVRITPQGLKPGAGALADRYHASGGRVSYIGKPHPAIYSHCLMLAATGPGGRAISIGDSLHHDIAGGRAAGIDTLLVMGGVHADALSADADPASLSAAIGGIAGCHGAIPDWAIPSFKW